MGFLSRLFGIEPPSQTDGYDSRLAEQSRVNSQSDNGPLRSPWGDGGYPSRQTAQGGNEPPREGAADPYHENSGQKVIPKLLFTKIDPHPSNDKRFLELWATIKNTSGFQVEITEIAILNRREKPCHYLKPHEQYEMRLYRGDTPRTDDYSDVLVRYKIADNGDYFEQQFFIDYHFKDGFYLPKAISEDRPVRDI